MIKEFVKLHEDNKDKLQAIFKEKHPESYKDIVQAVIDILNPDGEYGMPDPKKIHEIDDGDYQGTLLYVIPEATYQPDEYWYVKVGYGSCSGCDTLQSICGYSDEAPTEEQVKDYMTLALHIIQGLKKMDIEEN